MQILVENLDELESGNAFFFFFFFFHVYVWHYYQNPKIFISLILTLEIVLAEFQIMDFFTKVLLN